MHTTVYSTPTCPYCTLAKQFLKEHSISFTDVDVSIHTDKAQDMVQKTGQMGVPVIVVTHDQGNEDIIVGFDRDRLTHVLNIKV